MRERGGRFTGVVQEQQVRGQRQGTAAGGINDQEFFFNTKSTHLLSVADKYGAGRHSRSTQPWLPELAQCSDKSPISPGTVEDSLLYRGAKGTGFLIYQTENGVVDNEWGKGARFLDSEGNILSLSQRT